MFNICFLLLIILLQTQLYAQELPRRVYLGIRMENIPGDAKQIMGLKDISGVLIDEVLPNSTAEKAGFKRGDILSVINGTNVNSINDVFTVLANQTGGQQFTYTLHRNNKLVNGSSVFSFFPEENYTDLDVIYTETKSGIGLQRIIITKPKTKNKLPVIVFIGGMGCYSLDLPMDSNRSEIQLLNMLSRAGYLCARLEKPGIGDNANYSKACNEVSLLEEAEGYIQGIRKLKTRSDVDSNSVYILGHSMGGVFAPMIARKTQVKGVVAYGLIGSNFIEYLAKTRRTIGEAYEMTPEETDDLVKDFCECSGYYFVEKMTTEEAAKKKPICREYLSIFDLRSRAYNNELYALNIPNLWKSFRGKAAIIWGESDFISSKEDHQIVATSINFYHPGTAEFISVKNSDHGMLVASNFKEAKKNQGSYNTEIGKVILSWLKKQS